MYSYFLISLQYQIIESSNQVSDNIIRVSLSQFVPSFRHKQTTMMIPHHSCFRLLLLLLLLVPTEIDTAATSNCKTTRGKKCVFPFTYKGKNYTSCTWDGAFDNNGNKQVWCGTSEEVDRWEPDTWGDCGGECDIPGRI